MLNYLQQVWERFVYKNKQPAYVVYFIVMPGVHGIPIRGLDGLGLKEVTGDTFIRHNGLKYWAQSAKGVVRDNETMQKALSQRAREDIFNLIFNKKLQPFEGIYV